MCESLWGVYKFKPIATIYNTLYVVQMYVYGILVVYVLKHDFGPCQANLKANFNTWTFAYCNHRSDSSSKYVAIDNYNPF